jgi:two-component system sensor histidine kinase PilS (NtrC family)
MSATTTSSLIPLPVEPLQSSIFSKLKWLMFFRLLLATSLFGSAVVVQIRDVGESYSPLLYALIIAIYLFSAVYAAVIKRVSNLAVFAYIQFFFDTLFITPLIYVTGGIESIFSFLYFLTIISASYLLFTPGAFYAATLSGICYAMLITLLATRVLPGYQDATAPHDLSYVFYNITINIFAFFLVAFLSSYLAEQLKRTGEALIEEQLNLRELEELNRKIVENMNSGLMTIDPQGRITFLNRAAQQMIGLSLESVFGTSVDQIFPATFDHLKDIQIDEESVLKPTRWERHFTRKDKQRLYLGFSTSPLRNQDGREVGKILIFEDLTRIKYLEEKARRDDRLTAIGKLAAGIAHEIRNPLASISGSIQVLRDELDVEDENRALMDIVLRETDRLNGLLTDFLYYVRPTALVRRPVELERLIQEVLEALRRNPKCGPDVEIVTRFSHSSRLEADSDQLRQVIWNLALNAVEVMPRGGRLEVTTRDLPDAQGDPSPRVEIAVADSGPGIDRAVQERLFDPFFSTKPGGTGLGLALVEKIVQGHDGLVRARAGRSGGTVFEVSLPAQSPSPVSRTEPEEASADAEQ